MSGIRELIVETRHTHRMARGWNYLGTNIECDETHLTGMVCRCGWARMSDEPDVVSAAYDTHEADEIAAALVGAGFLADAVLASLSGESMGEKT